MANGSVCVHVMGKTLLKSQPNNARVPGLYVYAFCKQAIKYLFNMK